MGNSLGSWSQESGEKGDRGMKGDPGLGYWESIQKSADYVRNGNNPDGLANPICYRHKNETSVSCYRNEPAFIHASNVANPDTYTKVDKMDIPSQCYKVMDVKGDRVDSQTMWVCTDNHEDVNNHMYVIYQDYLQMKPYVADGWCPKQEGFCTTGNLIQITLDNEGDDVKGWYCYEDADADPTDYKSGFSPCGGKDTDDAGYAMGYDAPRLEALPETALYGFQVEKDVACYEEDDHELLEDTQADDVLQCAELCNDCDFFEYQPETSGGGRCSLFSTKNQGATIDPTDCADDSGTYTYIHGDIYDGGVSGGVSGGGGSISGGGVLVMNK